MGCYFYLKNEVCEINGLFIGAYEAFCVLTQKALFLVKTRFCNIAG